MVQKKYRSFKLGTVDPLRLKDCKTARNQTLTSGNLAATLAAVIHNTSQERSILFLKYTILINCVAALLRFCMWSQITPISLHKMAFQ